MGFIKKLSIFQKIIIVSIVAILIIIGGYKLINYLTSDKMNNAGIVKVKYRVYTKENGWSKWCKNGNTCGNGKDDILDVEVSMKKGSVSVELFNGKKWIKSPTKTGKKYVINILTDSGFLDDYNVCFRTYNSSDKWLGWACDNLSGNTKNPIKKN